MPCPIIPTIRKYRPELLKEAMDIGPHIRGSYEFMCRHKFMTKEMATMTNFRSPLVRNKLINLTIQSIINSR